VSFGNAFSCSFVGVSYLTKRAIHGVTTNAPFPSLENERAVSVQLLTARFLKLLCRHMLLTGRGDTRAISCVNVREEALRGHGVEPVNNIR
jgi:hypothetical protein